ncbi:MAG: hypothetical protein V1802_02370 [Candidatus Aenigmatarchaeota archaeon]
MEYELPHIAVIGLIFGMSVLVVLILFVTNQGQFLNKGLSFISNFFRGMSP